MVQKSLVFVLILFLFLSSCSSSISETLIWIDVPVNNLHLTSPQEINIEGHASSPEGVARVEIWVNGEISQTIESFSGVETTVGFSWSFTPGDVGEYIIQVIAAGQNQEISEPDTSRVIIGEVAVVASPTPTEVPPPTPPDDGPTPIPLIEPTPVPVINYWADPEDISAGDCTTLYWEVENVQLVVFGGHEQEFSGSYHDCMCVSQSYPLTITYLDDTSEQFYVTIGVSGTCETPTPVDTTPPAAPLQLKPLDGADLGCLPNAILRWQAPSDPSGISEYRVQVERHSGDFNWQAVSDSPFKDLSDTNLTITVECGYDYRWRVRAVDGNGNLGSWSGWFTFRIPLI